ncbi:g8319 [Coccomyxa elongata]
MARMLLEDPSSEERILSDWESLLPQTLQEWGVNGDHIAAFSDGYRNASLIKDRHAWTYRNQLYGGIYEAVRSCTYPWYVASSKAPHRVSSLMWSLLGIEMEPSSPRLFAGLIPPEEEKSEALRTISQRPLVRTSGARIHFIDDRLETLKAVRKASDLHDVQLYLADWGYNTEEERQAAVKCPGIKVLTLPQCCELLKWGIIMEVDDGCEPTQPEVIAGVGL